MIKRLTLLSVLAGMLMTSISGFSSKTNRQPSELARRAIDADSIDDQCVYLDTLTQTDSVIVDTDHQKYSYSEMQEDLNELQKTYPSLISVENRTKTAQGRSIAVVYFGDRNAKNKIMITASIHAREYMTTQLVMALLENYAKNYNTGQYKGKKYSELFANTCLVILPMVNPDGVMIAQKGTEGVITKEAKEWVSREIKKGRRYNQIKSNSRGIDLNRNFSTGFGKDPRRVGHRGFDHYNGTRAYSEEECQLMKKIAEESSFVLFLNYHTHGNILYYGTKSTTLKEVNTKAFRYAKMIQEVTNYQPKSESYPAYGSWADEVEYLYKSPSVTIEVGSRNPVPISEFNSIYKRNKDVWARLVYSLIQ